MSHHQRLGFFAVVGDANRRRTPSVGDEPHLTEELSLDQAGEHSFRAGTGRGFDDDLELTALDHVHRVSPIPFANHDVSASPGLHGHVRHEIRDGAAIERRRQPGDRRRNLALADERNQLLADDVQLSEETLERRG